MPIVIKEIVIKSPPPDAEPPALEVKLPDVLISNYQTSGHDAGAVPASGESFSWYIAHEGASFDGRLLTARDLTGEQDSGETGSSGETTLADVVVVKQLDGVADAAFKALIAEAMLGTGPKEGVRIQDRGDTIVDFAADMTVIGTAASGFGDGGVRFVSAGVDGGVW